MDEYMHNASMPVKAKRIYNLVQIAPMDFDDRPDAAKRLEKARVAAGFPNARQAAQRFGWTYETYVQHENGIRGIVRAADKYAKAFRVSKGWLLTGEGAGPNGAPEDEAEAIFRELTADEREDVKRHARGLIALRKSSAG